jgi:hypothetical protein
MLKGILVVSVIPLLFCTAFPASADALPAASGFALSAMAPAGRWATKIELRTNSYDQWFNGSGQLEKFNAPYDKLNLDSSFFPALAAFPPGSTLGTSSLNSKAEVKLAQIVMGYGLTDDVTVGFYIPFIKTRSQIDFTVAGGNVGFNTGFNPALAVSAGNFPLAPVGFGAVAPLGTAGVKQLLTNPVFGYGYAPIETTETTGFGDATAGVLWRYHKTQQSSAILGAGMRFGIAKGDNPDSLVDIPVDDGSTDFRLRLEYFRDLGHEFDLRLLAENTMQLADKADMRVPQPGQLLATASSKERLDRNLGDYREYDIELGHRWGDWRTSATWHRYSKSADHYRSDLGTNTGALETNTNVRADQWRAGLSWSGVNAWQQGKFVMPLIIKLELQETYDGLNFPKVRDVYLQFTSFF